MGVAATTGEWRGDNCRRLGKTGGGDGTVREPHDAIGLSFASGLGAIAADAAIARSVVLRSHQRDACTMERATRSYLWL